MPFFFSSGCTRCPVQGAQQPAAGFPLLWSREMNYFDEIFLLWTRMISQALTVCQCHQAVPCWLPKMEIWLRWNELLFLTFLGLQLSCQYLLVIHWGVNSGRPLLFLLFVFQVITLEGWVEIMYYVMDAHSFYNFIYFILLIIVSIRFDECQQCKLSANKKQVLDQHRYWGSKLLGISEIQLVDFHQESEAGSDIQLSAKNYILSLKNILKSVFQSYSRPV